jgi:hypothetical protein
MAGLGVVTATLQHMLAQLVPATAACHQHLSMVAAYKQQHRGTARVWDKPVATSYCPNL